MSTITLGTAATTTLTTGLVVPSQSNGATTHFLPADIAAFNNAVKSQSAVGTRENNAFRNGVLFFPGKRGYLRVNPGDYLGVDPNGWPVLVSAYAIATGGWTHT